MLHKTMDLDLYQVITWSDLMPNVANRRGKSELCAEVFMNKILSHKLCNTYIHMQTTDWTYINRAIVQNPFIITKTWMKLWLLDHGGYLRAIINTMRAQSLIMFRQNYRLFQNLSFQNDKSKGTTIAKWLWCVEAVPCQHQWKPTIWRQKSAVLVNLR